MPAMLTAPLLWLVDEPLGLARERIARMNRLAAKEGSPYRFCVAEREEGVVVWICGPGEDESENPPEA